jgi:hypothetical protein
MQEKCSKCGKETPLQNSQGECYDCMNEVDKKLALFQLQKLEQAIKGKSEDKNLTKEEFESEAKMEEKVIRAIAALKKEYDAEKALEEAEKNGNDVKFSEKGASGSVSLRPEDAERENSQYSEGYDSVESMINDLRSKGDKETLDKIWQKAVLGMKDNPEKTLNFTYKDNWENGKSAIRRKLDRDNEKLRKRD